MKAALVAFLVLAAMPAQANIVPKCREAEGLHKTLAQRYGEAPLRAGDCKALGAYARCIYFENPTSGSWTFVVYLGNGDACPIASGAIDLNEM